MMSSGPGSHHTVPLTQSQIAQQQQQQEYARELAKRRSRKPTDKTLPEGVVEALVDPEVCENYNKLRDFERRLDATMTRKRLDIADSVNRNSKVRNGMARDGRGRGRVFDMRIRFAHPSLFPPEAFGAKGDMSN
jgi:hypothetical protein